MISVLFCNGLLRKSLFFFERDETNDDDDDGLYVPLDGAHFFQIILAEAVLTLKR